MTTCLYRSLRFGLAMLAFVPLIACAAPPIYFAKATQATVVDAESHRAIEGAVVVADWILYGKGGGDRVMEWEVTEVVTDVNGDFLIPGWGPKVRPGFAELTDRDPEMIIFKSGYEPRHLSNKVTMHPSQASVRVSDWNGKTIELKPFRGAPEKRVEQLEFVVDSFDHGPPLNALYRELSKERDALGKSGKGLFIDVEHLKEKRR